MLLNTIIIFIGYMNCIIIQGVSYRFSDHGIFMAKKA